MSRRSRGKKGNRRINEDDYVEEALFAQAATLQFQSMLKELESMKNRHIFMIKKYVEFAHAQLPPHIRKMTLAEIEAMEEKEKRAKKVGNSFVSSSFEEMRSKSSGLAFRVSSPPPNFRRPPAVIRRRRSSSQDSYFKSKLTYMTPGVSKLAAQPITPKVNPDSPVGMLRLPMDGEFAVSATGSPLLVSTHRMGSANVNIPLSNGVVMSVLPKRGINTETISGNLDPAVRQQLQTLTDTLNAILRY